MKKRIIALLFVLCLVLILTACGGKNASYDMNYSTTEAAMAYPEEAPMAPMPAELAYNQESMESAGLVEAQPINLSEKIIYSASARVETLDYEASVDQVYALVDRFGGFLESSQVSGVDYFSASRGNTVVRSASFVIRVPVQNFAGMQEALEQVGNVTSLNTWTENVTARFYDTQARLEAYETEAENLRQMLSICETVEDMITVQERLSQVQYEIDALRSTLQNWQNQVDYSTINLTVQEVIEYTEPEAVPVTYGQRLTTSFTDTLGSIGDFFQDALIVIVCLIPILAIFAVIWLIIHLIRRAWLKKHPEHKTRRQRRQEAQAAASRPAYPPQAGHPAQTGQVPPAQPGPAGQSPQAQSGQTPQE